MDCSHFGSPGRRCKTQQKGQRSVGHSTRRRHSFWRSASESSRRSPESIEGQSRTRTRNAPRVLNRRYHESLAISCQSQTQTSCRCEVSRRSSDCTTPQPRPSGTIRRAPCPETDVCTIETVSATVAIDNPGVPRLTSSVRSFEWGLAATTSRTR